MSTDPLEDGVLQTGTYLDLAGKCLEWDRFPLQFSTQEIANPSLSQHFQKVSTIGKVVSWWWLLSYMFRGSLVKGFPVVEIWTPVSRAGELCLLQVVPR